MLAAAHQLPNSSLADTFKLMDTDGNGSVSKEELLTVLCGSPGAAGTLQPLLDKYFGGGGTAGRERQVSFKQFGGLMGDLYAHVLKLKWMSLGPDAANTASLAAFGQLVVRHAGADMPPQLVRHLKVLGAAHAALSMRRSCNR